MERVAHQERAVYVGQSALLHYCPLLLLATAVLPLLAGAPYAALVLATPAVVAHVLLPWRFAVTDSGIGLWFGFGKYRFLDKGGVTVRFRNRAPVVFHHSRARFGYGLTDAAVHDDPAVLRAVLSRHTFRTSD